MTHHTDILHRPPIMRPITPEPEPEQHDWTGERLIRAPKRKPEPEPEPIKAQRMHWKERRELAETMHNQGKDLTAIMQATGSTRETIVKDLKALGLFTPTPNMRGDVDLARKAFRQFCKDRKITQASVRDNPNRCPEWAEVRGDCLLYVHEAAGGATTAILARATGMQPKTIVYALRAAKERRDAK